MDTNYKQCIAQQSPGRASYSLYNTQTLSRVVIQNQNQRKCSSFSIYPEMFENSMFPGLPMPVGFRDGRKNPRKMSISDRLKGLSFQGSVDFGHTEMVWVLLFLTKGLRTKLVFLKGLKKGLVLMPDFYNFSRNSRTFLHFNQKKKLSFQLRLLLPSAVKCCVPFTSMYVTKNCIYSQNIKSGIVCLIINHSG